MSEMLLERTEGDTMANIVVTVGDPIGVGDGLIHAEGMEHEENAQAVAEAVKRHVVSVSEDAPSSCIDGRQCVSCMDGEKSEPRPGVAGGGLISAYAAAELVGWFSNDETTSEQRLKIVLDQLNEQGIITGAHCDTAALDSEFVNEIGASKTGCGADDNLPRILQTMYSQRSAIDSFTYAILGDQSDAEISYVDAQTLASRHEDWDPKKMLDHVGEEAGPHGIEILDSGDGTVPNHGHGELAAVFNDAEGTTVDRDSLFAETGIQVFDVDVWYLRTLARAMATGPDAESQEADLLQAMVSYQVATYLTLCDGTQRPIILQAKLSLAA